MAIERETAVKLQEIGSKIKAHRRLEELEYAQVHAIGGAECMVESSAYPQKNGRRQYWLVNSIMLGKTVDKNDGHTISKNSPMGGAICQTVHGKTCFSVRMKPFGIHKISIDIKNMSSFTPTAHSVKEIAIRIAGDNQVYTFQDLDSLLGKENEMTQRLKVAKEKEEIEAAERRAREEAARKERERIERELSAKREAERKAAEERLAQLERERKEREEAEKKAQEEINQLENAVSSIAEQVKVSRSFIRNEMSLRSQHILDSTQEDAKRDHIFDGVPVVINGGPGTGKTTTMIQRLRFLLDREALTGYENSLSEKQIEELLNPMKVNSNWMFFSPTPLLLRYLQNNMVVEGLSASEQNTTTLADFRGQKLLQYKLTNPDTNSPFKQKNRAKMSESMILLPNDIIIDFELFCVENIKEILLKAANLTTSNFEWHSAAVRIKSLCIKAADVKSLSALIHLLYQLNRNEYLNSRSITEEGQRQIQRYAQAILAQIERDTALNTRIAQLIDSWNTPDDIEEEEDTEAQDQTEEEETPDLLNAESKVKIYTMLKSIIKNLCLRKFGTGKLTKRQHDVYDLIEGLFDKDKLSVIGDYVWFDKQYAFLCKGVESNLLNQIPRLYKAYRKKAVAALSPIFNQELLSKYIKDNRTLLPDEVDLLIGFINNLAHSVYRNDKSGFLKSNHKYLSAYRESVKYVIGMDEATDYSLMDYYLVNSFLHYDFSSLTLCGDIMQGLNSNGISSWNELKEFILPKLEVKELQVSYRQLPSLVSMSQAMYFDDQHAQAPFASQKPVSEFDPAPLAYVTDDEEDEANWVAQRIMEVYKHYDSQMPSVAIFVGDKVNIEDYINQLYEQDCLNDIKIEEGTKTNVSKCVRIFKLSEVKGMEFEVAFFHNIDEALAQNDKALLRRYLYVGISRATTHLAATFTCKEGNEDILKYFDSSKQNWQ